MKKQTAIKGWVTPYTLRAAAEALGVAPGTVSNWLREGKLEELPLHAGNGCKPGVRLVSAQSVRTVAKAMGVTL